MESEFRSRGADVNGLPRPVLISAWQTTFMATPAVSSASRRTRLVGSGVEPSTLTPLKLFGDACWHYAHNRRQIELLEPIPGQWASSTWPTTTCYCVEHQRADDRRRNPIGWPVRVTRSPATTGCCQTFTRSARHLAAVRFRCRRWSRTAKSSAVHLGEHGSTFGGKPPAPRSAYPVVPWSSGRMSARSAGRASASAPGGPDRRWCGTCAASMVG